jgi:proline dehydrogenase
LVKTKELGLSVLVDAEESWFQDSIDTWVLELMREFNKDRAVLYQTVQMYRKDRLTYINDLIATADKERFFVGVKLVRGAYMEKENERAKNLSYSSPIHDSKEACDLDFNAAMDLCVDHIERVALFLGTHNESSALKLAQKIAENSSLSRQDPRLVFSQLYGMSDALTFNLAEAGFNTVKYVPYGPVIAAIPYLIRRSQENTSMQGQMGRELFMIKKEIQRRKLEH